MIEEKIDLGCGIRDLRYGIRDSGSETRDTGYETRDTNPKKVHSARIQDHFAGWNMDEVIKRVEDERLEESRGKKKDVRGQKKEQIKDSPIYIEEHENHYEILAFDEREKYYEVEIRKTLLGLKTLEGHASAANDVRGTTEQYAASIATFYEIISVLHYHRRIEHIPITSTKLRDYITQKIIGVTSTISFLTEIVIEPEYATESECPDSITQECRTPDSHRTENIRIDNIHTLITPEKIQKMPIEEQERITKYVQAMLSTKDDIQKISEVFKWFTKKPLYISTPKREERHPIIGSIRIGITPNAFNFIHTPQNEEYAAIGIRKITRKT